MNKEIQTYKGLTSEGQAVLESESGQVSLVSQEELKEKYEKAESKGEALVREMRDLFKDGFLGLEEVETAFTLKDGVKLIKLASAEREQALHLLEAKLNEPDIKEFLQKTPKQELAQDWHLRLRLPKLQDGTPLTMKTIQEKLAPDMLARNQGKLLTSVDWYANESFYTADTPKDMHWQLVTRQLVPSTKGKNHSSQTKELKKAAQAAHLDPAKTRRRAPVETIFDFAVSLRSKGQRILETEYDWSDASSSGSGLVDVGGCDAGGASVFRDDPGASLGILGASLSR